MFQTLQGLSQWLTTVIGRMELKMGLVDLGLSCGRSLKVSHSIPPIYL